MLMWIRAPINTFWLFLQLSWRGRIRVLWNKHHKQEPDPQTGWIRNHAGWQLTTQSFPPHLTCIMRRLQLTGWVEENTSGSLLSNAGRHDKPHGVAAWATVGELVSFVQPQPSATRSRWGDEVNVHAGRPNEPTYAAIESLFLSNLLRRYGRSAAEEMYKSVIVKRVTL